MNIGEPLQIGARRPVGQARPSRGGSSSFRARGQSLSSPCRSARRPCHRSVANRARGATPAITARRAATLLPSASSTPVAQPPSCRMRATGALHSTVPPRASIAATSARITVSAPPLPSTMPKDWFGHAFEIGKQGAAPDIGRKIEVHAPGAQQCRDLRVLERLAQPVAGRGQQETHHVERARDPLGPKRFKHEICNRTKLHRTAQQPEEMRGLGGKAQQPAVAMSRHPRPRRRRCAPQSPRISVETPSQLPSGKTEAKQSATGAKSRPLTLQFRAVCLEKRGSREK